MVKKAFEAWVLTFSRKLTTTTVTVKSNVETVSPFCGNALIFQRHTLSLNL